MVKSIIYDGKESTVLKILELLSKLNQRTSAVRVYGFGITIPTHNGASTAYKGDEILFDMNDMKIVIKPKD